MCNFAPGEAIAFGRLSLLAEFPERDFPGIFNIVPLASSNEEAEVAETLYDDFGFLHVTDIPEGREIEVVSKLSADFGHLVSNGDISVDLNYFLPRANPAFMKNSLPDLRLSKPAREWANSIQRHLGRRLQGSIRPVAVLDSGVAASKLGGRPIRQLDFSNGRDGVDEIEPTDSRGHGTRVASILHAALPSNVPIVSARIGDADREVTVLNVARAFASTVVNYMPAVFNISLAPLDDTFVCPNCGEVVKVPAFHSRILRNVFALANDTFVVMASGNSGQNCNDRHLDETTPNLVFAVSVGSDLGPTEYSSFTDSLAETDSAVCAFGGDDQHFENGYGMFEVSREDVGTSYAAPLVTASIYASVIEHLEYGETLDRESVLHRHHHTKSSGWYPDWRPLRRDWY